MQQISKSIITIVIFIFVSTFVSAEMTKLSIDKIHGNTGKIAIHFTIDGDATAEFITDQWAFSTDNRKNWIPISENAIIGNEPKTIGNSVIFWDSRKSLPNVNVDQIWFRCRAVQINADQNWKSVTDLPTPRHGFATAILNGQIYVIGGFDGTRQTASVLHYDPKNGFWKNVAPMKNARQFLSAVVIDGKIYAIGGFGPGGYSNAVEVYDANLDQWKSLTDLPTPRNLHSATVWGDSIFVTGGHRCGGLDTVEVYDIAKDQWQTSAPLPDPRHGHASIEINAEIYVFGGRSREPISTVLAFNPKSGKWRKIGDLPKSSISVSVIDLAQGVGAIVFADENVFEFDQKSDRWQTLTPLKNRRNFGGFAKIGNSIYAIGGRDEKMLSSVDRLELPQNSHLAVSQSFEIFNQINAEITDPKYRSVKSRRISIVGTVETEDLKNWKLEIAKGKFAESGYKVINVSAKSVIESELGKFDATDFENGVYTLRLIVSDRNDKTTITYVNFEIDNTELPKPIVKIRSENGSFANSADSIFVEGTTVSDVKIDRAILTNGDQNASVKEFITIDKNGVISGEIAGVNFEKDGDLTLKISVKDRAGTRAEAESNAVPLDNSPPQIAIISPAFGANFTNAVDDLFVKGKSRDVKSGLAKIEFKIGNDWKDLPISEAWEIPISPIANSSVEIQIRATDNAGNEAIEFLQFSFFTDLPEIDLTSPIDGNLPYGSVSVHGKVKGNFTSWKLEFASGENATDQFREISKSTDQVDGIIATWNVSNLPAGIYTLRLIVETADGKQIIVKRRKLFRVA